MRGKQRHTDILPKKDLYIDGCYSHIFLHGHLFDIIFVTTIPSTSTAAALYILVVDGMEIRVKNLHTTSTAAAQYILVVDGMEDCVNNLSFF